MADPSTCLPLTPESVIRAHEVIKPYIDETPLLTSRALNRIASLPNPKAFFSADLPTILAEPSPSTTPRNSVAFAGTPRFNLYFKAENHQKIGAFKVRGAFHALLHLIESEGIDEVRRRGVTTHSSGNHAQSLAFAAYTFDIPSYIVMPKIATSSKIANTRLYTDNVIFSGSSSKERQAKMKEVVEATGAIYISSSDHADIILGQGTAGLEMENQFRDLKNLESQQRQEDARFDGAMEQDYMPREGEVDEVEPQFDAVITSLGGGGLLGGVATWFSHTTKPQSQFHSPSSRRTKPTLVFGAEPSQNGANEAERGLAANPPERIPHVASDTIAEGLRMPVGVLNWTIVSDKSKMAGVYSVSEEEIKLALRLMLEQVKVWVEPSAVVGVAVVLFCEEFRNFVARRQREEGTRRAWDVGVVLSGGNTTIETVTSLLGGESEDEE